MILSNYFWCFKSALTPRFCDEVIKYGLSQEESIARTGGFDKPTLSKQDVKNIQKKRRSDLVWLNDTWIYKEIQPYVHQANANAGWNFQWDYSENCQFTKYKKGQYYDWHCDGWDKPYQRQQGDPSNGKVRKLSVTLTLSDPKDYKGGELEFDFRNLDPDKKPNIRKCKEILPKGSLVVFPADLWHRVCPVKKGSRYSLVIWSLGWPFK